MLSPAEMEAATYFLDGLYKPLDDHKFVGVYIGVRSMPELGTLRHVIEVQDPAMTSRLDGIRDQIVREQVYQRTWKGFTVVADGTAFLRPWIFPLLILLPAVDPPVIFQEGGRYMFRVKYSCNQVFPIGNNANFNIGAGGMRLEVTEQIPPESQ